MQYSIHVRARVDLVLTKCGYGMCSEIVAHRTPFMYVPRPGFFEEAYLLKNMVQPAGIPAVEMPWDMFKAGRWAEYVEKVGGVDARGVGPSLDGHIRAAEAVETLLSKLYGKNHC